MIRLQKKREDLEAELVTLLQQKQDLEKEIAALETEIQKLEDVILQLDTELFNLETQINCLQGEITALTKVIEDIVRKIAKDVADINACNAELQKLHQRMDSLNTEINALAKELMIVESILTAANFALKAATAVTVFSFGFGIATMIAATVAVIVATVRVNMVKAKLNSKKSELSATATSLANEKEKLGKLEANKAQNEDFRATKERERSAKEQEKQTQEKLRADKETMRAQKQDELVAATQTLNAKQTQLNNIEVNAAMIVQQIEALALSPEIRAERAGMLQQQLTKDVVIVNDKTKEFDIAKNAADNLNATLRTERSNMKNKIQNYNDAHETACLLDGAINIKALDHVLIQAKIGWAEKEVQTLDREKLKLSEEQTTANKESENQQKQLHENISKLLKTKAECEEKHKKTEEKVADNEKCSKELDNQINATQAALEKEKLRIKNTVPVKNTIKI